MPTPVFTEQATLFGQPRRLPPLEINSDLITDPALLGVAVKLAQGRRLERADGLALMTSRDLVGLGSLGGAARRALHGDQAFYVLNRHINYSNICQNRCKFCAFWRESDQEGAFFLSVAEAAAKAAHAPGQEVDELHVVGSCHPGLSFDYYPELLRALGQARPGATLKAFTAVEIADMAHASGQTPGQVLDVLMEAGLKAMPGGGAEVFSPRVRAALCPDKPAGQVWLEVSAEAHRRGVSTNATMLYGHIETPEERVDHLLALRAQQDATGGFSAFIPLAFHAANTGLPHLPPTTALDDLRVVAAARLLLDNFAHIKAYWVMLTPKLAQMALAFGADDMDGTIVEEHITHMAGATTAQGLTETELRGMISAAGWRPVRRDSFYRSLEAAS